MNAGAELSNMEVELFTFTVGQSLLLDKVFNNVRRVWRALVFRARGVDPNPIFHNPIPKISMSVI